MYVDGSDVDGCLFVALTWVSLRSVDYGAKKEVTVAFDSDGYVYSALVERNAKGIAKRRALAPDRPGLTTSPCVRWVPPRQ